MVRNPEIWEAFERQWSAEHPAVYEENLRMMNAMGLWAKKMGQFPRSDLWEGIDEIIAFSRVLHRVRPTPEKNL
ncbi:MAG: hypothetical protein JXB10_03450 [Pirellulales bacterium]|nr:hypothetical protein [Pirellulales bacterium]